MIGWKKGPRPALLAGLLGTALAWPALAQDVAPVTQDELLNPTPGEWIMIHGDYAAHRYSPLTAINRDTIGQLELAYTLAIAGVEGGGSRYANASLEATPLVDSGQMFFPNGWGVVYALDVTDPTHAVINWRMDPNIDKPWAGDVACCGINNRGVAFYQDQIISIALDGRMFALDRATGEVKWERTIADPALGETLTVGPQIVRDHAIVGPAGAEYGIRGWLDATNLTNGEQAWRTYTVAGPDEPGGETWINPGTYETGGGSIWVTGTYNPDLNLVYWGTGNPGPDWDAEYRPGDNLYTDSALALNPDTGEIVWYFQYTPNDPYDYDEIGEHHLVTVEIDGQTRNLALHPGRNGYFYGLDQATGEFIYGKQYVDDMSWTPGLDPKTGRPLSYDPSLTVQAYVPGSASRRDGTVGTLCPLITGGKNWEPSAYNPELQLLYVAGGEGCHQRITQVQIAPEWQGGTWKYRERFVGGAAPAAEAPPADPKWVVREAGSLSAIDVVTGEVRQKLQLDYVNRSGVLATAGGWVMIGEYDGWIRVFNAENLDEEIWRYNVGSSIKGPPMTYEIDGKQYIALLVGANTGAAQNRVNPMLAHFAPTHMLYVFKLDED